MSAGGEAQLPISAEAVERVFVDAGKTLRRVWLTDPWYRKPCSRAIG